MGIFQAGEHTGWMGRIVTAVVTHAYAVRYQEFLDNIEPTEHVYHRGDPAASIRQAIACAAASDSR